jgi:hypothetical protein
VPALVKSGSQTNVALIPLVLLADEGFNLPASYDSFS